MILKSVIQRKLNCFFLFACLSLILHIFSFHGGSVIMKDICVCLCVCSFLPKLARLKMPVFPVSSAYRSSTWRGRQSIASELLDAEGKSERKS